MKSLKIGVCGVGNVGGAVLDKLSNSSEIVEANGGVKIEIAQVGARKGKSVVPFDLPVSSNCLLYTSPSPRDATLSRMPSSA